MGKFVLIALTVIYISVAIVIPNTWLLVETFAPGGGSFIDEIMAEHALAALANTGIIVAMALLITVPMGVMTSIVLVRDHPMMRKVIDRFIDLPFSAPAAISAFGLILTYGPKGLFGGLLEPAGIKIIFAMPGMLLATVFVTLPFVIREVTPLLEEIGTEAEEAARTLGASTWQTIMHVTIPNVSDGIVYGASLSYARALGEFGAILIISGNILGRTQTTPLYIYGSYINFQMQAAYSGAVLLLVLAVGGITLLESWRKRLQA